jgi:uncharacterized protein YndB with AHSA1/START domain
MSETKFTVLDDRKTLVVERTFSAPRSKVWQAWTTPDLFVQWWGPTGWTTEAKEFNFSEGGSLLYGMKCEDPAQGEWYGKTSWGKMTFSNINPESSFDYMDEFTDENGTVTPKMPITRTEMKFEEQNGKTHVVCSGYYDSPEALEQVMALGMKEGLTQTWDRLEELVQG